MLEQGPDHKALADRVHEQTVQFDRHVSQERRDERKLRPASASAKAATHPGLWSGHYGPVGGVSEPSSHEGQIGNWLDGHADKVQGESKTLEPEHLFWQYKSTPHAPASTFLKYLVHRVNNVDLYDDHEAGHKADVEFLKLHQQGEAGLKNGHITPDDLHNWTKRHAPTVIPGLLAHRERAQGIVRQGVGLNVRDINGEPYVALTRGLNGDLMNREHALSSWSDRDNSGFGTHQHQAWVPLKDLWFAYDYGQPYESDTLGPEDEFLLSHTGPRYEAAPGDVQSSRIKSAWPFASEKGASPFPYAGHYDDATDEQLAEAIKWHGSWGRDLSRVPKSLLEHKNVGPMSKAVLEDLGFRGGGIHQLASTTREQVMAEARPESYTHFTAKTFRNPNLTPDDLVELGQRILNTQTQSNQEYLAQGLVDAPKASTEVLEKVWGSGADNFPIVAAELLRSPLASQKMLDQAVAMVKAPSKGGLGQEGRRRIAEAVLGNPYHSEHQADSVLASALSGVGGLYDVHNAKVSLNLLNRAGHILQGGKDELFPGALDQLGGEGQKTYATGILKNYVSSNPHANPEYLQAILDNNYVDPYFFGQRIKNFGTIPASVQVPLISKLLKLGAPVGRWAHDEGTLALEDVAKSKNLTPEAVNLLAHCRYPDVRSLLFKNHTVPVEVLENAWPKGMERPKVTADPQILEARLKLGVNDADPNPFEHLAFGIAARKAYAEKRAREHLIKPLPIGMAKSEAAWAIELRNWLAQVQDKVAYYHPCTRGEADDAMYYCLLQPQPTEDLLDGEAVFAYRASPEFVKKWQKTATPDQALVYFETKVEPEKHEDGRFFWTGIVPLDNAHVVEPDMSIEKHEELTGLGRVLAKMHGPVTFPRLGTPEDRRESYIIQNKRQLESKARAVAQKDVNELTGKIGEPPMHGARAVTQNPRAVSSTRSSMTRMMTKEKTPGLVGEYGPGYALAPSGWAGHGQPLTNTKPHEDMHLLLNRVQAKYGREGRKKLVANLFEALPSDVRDEVMSFAHSRQGKGVKNPDSGVHEEWLTYLISYLNDKSERNWAHPDPVQRRNVHDKMKRAYKAARAAAEVATPAWTQHFRPWLVRANNPPETQTDFADTRAPFGPYSHTQENLWESGTRPQSRLWTGQFVRKTEPQPEGAEPMMKGLKGLALGAALALPGMGAMDRTAVQGPPVEDVPSWQQVEVVEKLHPHLMAIRTLESSDGRDTNHAKNPTEYNTAWGELGLKPNTAHDVWRHSPQLQKKYPGLEDPNTFMLAFKALPGLHNGCANRHWNTLLTTFKGPDGKPDLRRAAFAWRHGRGATAAARPEDIEHDDYVQKFAAHPRIHLATPAAPPAKTAVKPTVPVKQTSFSPKAPLKVHKADPESLETLEPGEAKAALAQLGHDPRVDKAIQAALFLTGRQAKVDEAAFALALQVHDGDINRAALNAVGLTDSDKNLKALAAVLRLGSWDEQTPMELTKAEASPEVPAISSVQPAVPGAEDTADAVGRAVTAGLLHPLKLKGKHAAGATAAKDPQTGYIVLLKPGSGKQSPAAGARDDKSSQSAREACFYHVAKECGMGNYYPRADLLIVNAQEWAAMAMLGAKWKSLDEYNRAEDGNAREVLGPYLKRGDIHRLAAMDWILGNPDSHGQNIMTHGQAIALIDHGSAFAGPNFNPGLDTKSFIPYYLRVFGARGLSKLPPEERVKTLPVLDAETDDYLRDWLDDIKPGMVDSIMKEYGIGDVARKAVLSRLHDLQSYEGKNLSAYLDEHWAGVKPDLTKSEPLAKHSAESIAHFPEYQMQDNAERYQWPKPFDHPEVVQARQKAASQSFFLKWLNKLESSPAYRKWETAHGGPAQWGTDPKTGVSGNLGSPEVKEAQKLAYGLRHGGEAAPFIKWAQKTFPGSWTEKHTAKLTEVQKKAVKGDTDEDDDGYNSERRYWLSQMHRNKSLIKDPELRSMFSKRDYYDVDKWLKKEFTPAQQKKLIQKSFPQAFTKSKEYQDFSIQPHPAVVSGIQNGTITMNFPVSKLAQMTREGKYLNLHETGVGEGETDQSTRAEHEEAKFGIDPDTDGDYRPVYGALNWATKHHPAHAHFGAAPQYGDGWLELKPEVRERASYTPGDSFEVEPEQVFSHRHPDVLAHAFQQAQPGNSHAIIHKQPGDRWTDYIEAQIFGGVDFKNDVRALHLGPEVARLDTRKKKGGVSEYDKAIERARAFGAKHQVPVYLHTAGEGTGYERDETAKLRTAPANAFKVVPLYTPGEEFKPKKGVVTEEPVEYASQGEDEGLDDGLDDSEFAVDAPAGVSKPEKLAAPGEPTLAGALLGKPDLSEHGKVTHTKLPKASPHSPKAVGG